MLLSKNLKTTILSVLACLLICFLATIPNGQIGLLISIIGLIVGALLLTNRLLCAYIAIVACMLTGTFRYVPIPILAPDKLLMIIGVTSAILVSILKSRKIYLGIEISIFVIFICYTSIISYLKSPVLQASTNGIVQLVVVFLGFIVMTQINDFGRETVKKIILFFVVVSALETIYGVLSFFVYNASNINLGGIMFNQGQGTVTIKGTFLEANILGSTVGASLLFLIPLLLSGKIKNKPFWIITSFILFIGLIFSWTRSAWIGFILGLLIISIYYAKKIIQPRIVISFILVITILVPTFFVIQNQFDQATGIEGSFSSKLTNIFNSESGTGRFRINQFNFALNDLKGNEISGTGYYSIKKYGKDAWISNIFLFLYHDTGVIGLVIFCLILIAVLLRCIKFISNKKINDEDRSYMLGLFSGYILLLFSYNFTPAHVLSLFWVILGMIVAYSRSKEETEMIG